MCCLQVGFLRHLELLSNTWSQKSQCPFRNEFAPDFYNLMYLNGNLIHLFLIHLHLNHQNTSLLGRFDIREDCWNFRSSFRALKKFKKTGSFAFPRINQNAEEFVFSVLNLSTKVLSSVGGTGTSKTLATHSLELELLVFWRDGARVVQNTFCITHGFQTFVF